MRLMKWAISCCLLPNSRFTAVPPCYAETPGRALTLLLSEFTTHRRSTPSIMEGDAAAKGSGWGRSRLQWGYGKAVVPYWTVAAWDSGGGSVRRPGAPAGVGAGCQHGPH